MKNAFVKIVFTACILVVVSGCATNTVSPNQMASETDKLVSTLEIENNSLKGKLHSLELDKFQLESQLKEITEISLLDSNYEPKKRFVQKKSEIRPLPIGSVKPFRDIQTNSVIDVIDSVNNNGEIWLYVSIPVYDTPVNNKGWVKESETVPLTEVNVKLVQSNVTLRKGTPIYNVDSIMQIKSAQPTITSNDILGRIERRQDAFVNIMTNGGWYFWVDAKYIIYPRVD